MKALLELAKRTREAGNELRGGLSSARSRIEELVEQREAVEQTPATMEVAIRRVEEFVDQVSLSGGDLFPAPEQFLEGSSFHRPEHFQSQDVLSHYLHPVLVEAMIAAVRKASADLPGISEQERQARLTKIDAQILEAELAEEGIVRAAEAAGFSVDRRPDVNPAVVLAPDEDLP